MKKLDESRLDGTGKAICRLCGHRSLPGLVLVLGKGYCPYHWAAENWGYDWADQCHPNHEMAIARRPKRIEEILKRNYTVLVEPIDVELGGGFKAYLPDFGESACSAVGDTKEEARANLRQVKEDTVVFYLESGRPIPVPSKKWSKKR